MSKSQFTYTLRGRKFRRLDPPAIMAKVDGRTWPRKVPLLDAEDIYTGAYASPENPECRCLLGHARHVFGAKTARLKAVKVALVNRIRDITDAAPVGGEFGTITNFNDCYASPGLVARVWNETMADLGYTQTVSA